MMIYSPLKSASPTIACLIGLLFTTWIIIPVHSQSRLLDNFEDVSGWQPITSDGVKLDIKSVPGYHGQSLALDFEFYGGSGYAIAQKRLPLELPANYKFTFYLRGDTPPNNFEFKLLDSQDNVYWIKELNIDYPGKWTQKTIRKRHITFAWGPSGPGTIQKVDRIEFVVSAGTGGKGQIFIDEFALTPIDDTVQPGLIPGVTASSSTKESSITRDGNTLSNWSSLGTGEHQWLVVDFQKEREIGGLVIDWNHDNFAIQYQVELSEDGRDWRTAYVVTKGNGNRDYLYLPEVEARLLRLNLTKSSRGRGYGIDKIDIKGFEFSSSLNSFYAAIAADAAPGYYPKYLLNQQSYWTIVGVSGDSKEALINEQGQVEIDKLSFSLEPFLYLDQHLVTWHDVSLSQSLDHDYLPIPSVTWKYQNLRLTTQAFATGVAENSLLLVSYTVQNNNTKRTAGKLYITLRPFQVLPPWQALNLVGGATVIEKIKYDGVTVTVNDAKQIIPLTRPGNFAAAEFDQGDITDYLKNGTLPPATKVADHFRHASAAFAYDFDLAPGNAKQVFFVIPFHDRQPEIHPNLHYPAAKQFIDTLLHDTRQFWHSQLNKVQISLPSSAQNIINTFKSNLAYIMINRDGPAIQPGSRTYERAWIRDGSLTSTALLQTGHAPLVRDYLDWYAQYQYPNGKIPCVVDSRGADPVPEHDSHGQFIYAIMEYFRFTHDTTWLRSKLPGVVKTVKYIQELRSQRKTDEYRLGNSDKRACYGLVPESISHEGYSAQPMHSYWDDFFVLRGLKDAATMASISGEKSLEYDFARERDDFATDFYNSMHLAMANHQIDYIPGCVELGDFDPTSTTIGISPGGELGRIPEPQLGYTFDKYYQFFQNRLENNIDWANYTPYETRIIGSYIYLDQKHRAHALIDFFMRDRRPPAWNHWAEVVWREPSAPKFIGDMPHTWVGSDFIRAIRTMFVYEREQDQALVLGAGIPEHWVRDPAGVAVTGLPTYYGMVNYNMKLEQDCLVVNLAGNFQIPVGKIILKSPISATIRQVIVDGEANDRFSKDEVMIDKVPVEIEIYYGKN